MSPSKSLDVVICGGGAVGAAIAYYLSKLRLRVLIVESHSIARGASGFAAGIISAPGPFATGPMGRLHTLSFNEHRDLASSLSEQTGLEYDFEDCPMLSVADTPNEARALRAAARLQFDQGGAESSIRWINSGDVPDVCPWIDLPVSGGLLNLGSALVDPRKFTEALVAAARRLGASTRHARVTGITQSRGRVTGVELGGETVSAGSAVFAMGPWTAEASDWLGFEIPVYPLKGQILRLRIDGPLHQAGFSNGEGDYLVPKPSGLVYVGTTEESVGFEASPTGEARRSILSFASRYVSSDSEAEVVEQTVCLRPMSRDEIPIMGRVPGTEGAYVATGHGRSGILLSTGSGRAMAELIAGGRSECLDLTPFDPARFTR